MAAKASSPALQFAVEALKQNKNATFGDLKAGAAKKGLKLIPIVFGRAKLALGIAKKGPAKAKKAPSAAALAFGAPVVKRGPGRPRKNALAPALPPALAPRRGRPPKSASAGSSAGFSGTLEQLSSLLRQSEAQRRALDQIAAILRTI